jgi:hypothetical protein
VEWQFGRGGIWLGRSREVGFGMAVMVKIKTMNIKDRILLFRKKRAIKRHKTAAYFKIVGLIAKRQAAELVKEKLRR